MQIGGHVHPTTLIAVDWGTTSFRAFRMGGDTVLERRETPNGILHVEPGGFDGVLRRAVGPWVEAGCTRILMSGMVGSRQGWREAPYLPCPANPENLAEAVLAVPFQGADLRIVPGLLSADADGVPEVMRGEEVQLAGVMPELGPDAVVCLPGSHSKWAIVTQGRIAGFTTHMTGEVFAALRDHTILARTIKDGPTDIQAFRRGVVRSGQAGGLLHHAFGVRAEALFERLHEAEAGSYLSGLLIGHEVRAASPGGVVHLVGTPALCNLYAMAVTHHGGTPRITSPDAAARGLALIGSLIPWT